MRRGGDEAAGGVDASHAGHRKVHDDNVRLHLGDDAQCFRPVGRFAGHADAGRLEHGAHALSDHGVVVDDHRLDRCFRIGDRLVGHDAATGSCTVTRVPPP